MCFLFLKCNQKSCILLRSAHIVFAISIKHSNATRVLMSYRFEIEQTVIVYSKHGINYSCDEYLRCIRFSLGCVFTTFGAQTVVFRMSFPVWVSAMCSSIRLAHYLPIRGG